MKLKAVYGTERFNPISKRSNTVHLSWKDGRFMFNSNMSKIISDNEYKYIVFYQNEDDKSNWYIQFGTEKSDVSYVLSESKKGNNKSYRTSAKSIFRLISKSINKSGNMKFRIVESGFAPGLYQILTSVNLLDKVI